MHRLRVVFTVRLDVDMDGKDLWFKDGTDAHSPAEMCFYCMNTMDKGECILLGALRRRRWRAEIKESVIIWLFIMKLVTINSILICANARNTISHWPRVSYDWLDAARSPVLCFYSAATVQTAGQEQTQGNFKSSMLSLFSSWTSAPQLLPSLRLSPPPRERPASLLLLFTGYSITLSTSGRLSFLEAHLSQSPLAPYM